MRLYKDFDFDSFEPWSGAVETYNRIKEEGKGDALEAILDDLYPDGMTETALNDLLWFEPDSVYEWLGITDEEEDEETPDLSAFNDFEAFCEGFGSGCEGCPFSSPLVKDCEAAFDEAKEKEAAAL